MTDTSKALPVGTVLQSDTRSYTIVEVLGHGGFGITYRATAVVTIENIKATAQFAIKEHFVNRFCEREGTTQTVSYSRPVAREVENSRKDFLSEARRLRNLSKGQNRHPNIVCVNETFEANNTAYFVMEYLDGESLSSYVKRRGPLNDNEMRTIMTPIINAVAFLHREYITHLDIKPANIMLTRDDNDRLRPVLIDFGMSRHFDPESGEPSSSIQQAGFSEGYAPIEQVQAFKHFYPGTDVYSLGATMLYALTGQTPMAAENLDDETLRNSIPAGLPASTIVAITEAMRIYRKQRPENAGALLSILSGEGDNTRILNAERIKPEVHTDWEATAFMPSMSKPQPPTLPKTESESESEWESEPYSEPVAKSRKGLYIGIVVVILLALGCAAWFTNGFGLLDEEDGPNPLTIVPGENFLERTADLNMKMIWVQGGKFRMGATPEQGPNVLEDEKPVRRVTLDSYYISATEVTQGQWEKVMGTTIQEQAKEAGSSANYGVGPNYPMYYVSWDEAQEFCNKLSSMTGRKYVLPTEAQWEYAARGGKNDDGTKYSGSDSVDDVAWYWDNSCRSIHRVKRKQPNSLGLYDMSGNVWEWCRDWYSSTYNVNDTNNPEGPSSGSDRVLRGGSWDFGAKGCRVSIRGNCSPISPSYDRGFRVVVIP